MADLERTVQVMLMGDDFNLDRTMRNANRDIDRFSQNVQDAAAPLADFGQKAAMTEAALIAMTVGGLAYAAKQAADFDSQFREITTLLDDTGESVDQFRGEILEYSQSSVKSIQDINNAIYNAISAGVSYEDALGSLSEAEELAVATKADLGASVKALVSTLNAYGASSDEAAQYAEILFETVKNGQTTMPELANKIANVTSIAANSGVGFEELAAAIASVTYTGLPTSETISGLKAAISNIIKPTAQAADMADKLGIEFNAAALESNGLYGVLQDVKEATGGNTEQMTKLFGSVEGLNVVMALTGKGAEKFEATIRQTAETTGTLSAAYEKMADDVKLQAQTLLNNIDVTMVGIGDRVIAGLEGVPEAASGVFAGINEAINTGAFDDVFAAIDSFGNDFRQALLDIAENAPEALAGLEFDGLISSFGSLRESIGGALDALMGGDLDLSTVDGLQRAAQRLLDLFAGLTRFTSGFVDGLQPLLVAVGKVAENFAEMDESGQEFAGMLTGLAKTVGVVLQVFDSLKAILIGLGGVIAGLVGGSAVTGFAALTGAIYGTKKAGDALGGWIAKKEVELLGEEAGLTAEEVKKLESEIKGLKEMTAELDRMNKSLEQPEYTRQDWAEIERETRKQWEEAGLDTSVLKFNVEADTSEAEKAISDIPPQIEQLEVPEIPVELQVKEAEQKIESIKQQGETARAAFEYTAEVKTAEIEKAKALIETIPEALQSSQQHLSDLYDQMEDDRTSIQIRNAIESEQQRRQEMLQLQTEAVKLQNELTQKRIERMDDGEAMIEIDSSGLEPALEMVMWNILEKVQIRANENVQDFLLGLDPSGGGA